ncbi:MAG: hypothetical protein ACRCVT_08420 [Leadbetterella sp.]
MKSEHITFFKNLSGSILSLVIIFCILGHYSVYSQSKKKPVIEYILVYQMPSYIELVINGNRGEYNEGLSNEMDLFIDTLLRQNIPLNVNTEYVNFPVKEHRVKVDSSMSIFFKKLEHSFNINKLSIPNDLREYYSNYDVKYVLVNECYGFTRTKINKKEYLSAERSASVVESFMPFGVVLFKNYLDLYSGRMSEKGIELRQNNFVLLDIESNKVAYFENTKYLAFKRESFINGMKICINNIFDK